MPSEKGKGPGGARLTVTAAQVAGSKGEIDRLNADLAPLKSFILRAAARRRLPAPRPTVCRRGERLCRAQGPAGRGVTPEALQYVKPPCRIFLSWRAAA